MRCQFVVDTLLWRGRRAARFWASRCKIVRSRHASDKQTFVRMNFLDYTNPELVHHGYNQITVRAVFP
jgi:hypothetical protein